MRHKYIDNLKGFTIFLVVLAHVAERYFMSGIYPSYTKVFELIYNTVYSFHMPLFMTISGFLFSTAYIDNSNILKKEKFIKHTLNLIIIYFLFSLFAYFAKNLFRETVLQPISWLNIFLIIFIPIGHLWYLHTLIILYTLNAIIVKPNINYRLLFFLFMTLELASTYLHNYFPNPINTCLKYEFFFFTGILLSKKPQAHIFSNTATSISIIIATITLLYTLKSFDLRPDNVNILQLPISYGLCLFLYKTFKKEAKQLDIFNSMGKRSLEIYLISQYPLTVLKVILPKFSYINGIFSLFLNTFFTLSIVYLAIYFLKKIKIYNYIFKPYSCITNFHNKRKSTM